MGKSKSEKTNKGTEGLADPPAATPADPSQQPPSPQTAPDRPEASAALDQSTEKTKGKKGAKAPEPKKKFLFSFIFAVYDDEKHLKEEKTVPAFADTEEEGMALAVAKLQIPEGWTCSYTQKFTRVPVQ